MNQRTAEIVRTTNETDIRVAVNLDGAGATDIETGVPFFDHMLTAFGRHSLIDLDVRAKGDIEVDAHHTVEDAGIVLGQAVEQRHSTAAKSSGAKQLHKTGGKND